MFYVELKLCSAMIFHYESFVTNIINLLKISPGYTRAGVYGKCML